MNPERVESCFTELHDRICQHLLAADPAVSQRDDRWQREEGGGGRSRVFADGRYFERAGINFSHVHGECLPPSATKARPQLANQPFTAMGVSLVFHPWNPYLPTTHFNVRFFTTRPTDGSTDPIWWFGGGFDLTPYYPFIEDVYSWHRAARAAVQPWGKELYPQFKKACDEYFYLPHRNETRGVGGLFFDDFNDGGFDSACNLACSVGDAFWPAYNAIFERRKDLDYGDRERQWQLYRRGRYVEFNLLYDRGTLFGIQSKGRTESILMSMPPLVRWEYDYQPEPDSPEFELVTEYLKPRDWLDT